MLSLLLFSSFAHAADPAADMSAKLLTIEQKLTGVRETQKQIMEKQNQIKEELASLKILINRFC